MTGCFRTIVSQGEFMEIKIFTETKIDNNLDEKIRKNLCDCFPSNVEYFSTSRGWNGIPSDITVVGFEEEEPIAHIGVIFRTIDIMHSSYHIFGLQNVYVIPKQRGKHFIDMLFNKLLDYLDEYNHDFGLLFARPKVSHLYTRLGWRKMDNICLKENWGGEIKKRKLSHDSLYFYPMKVLNPPEGCYFLNGPSW